MSRNSSTRQHIVLFDHGRNGIFIHRDCLPDQFFSVGDRFSIHKGKRDLFSLKIKKDRQGDILLDKNGIFIARSTRVDILLGGIYDEFNIEFPGPGLEVIIIRPR